MTTKPLTYITFKGIYIATTATYFLCDFYRDPVNNNYAVLIDVMGQGKSEIHFTKSSTDNSWEYTSVQTVSGELVHALTEQILLLEQSEPTKHT